LRAGEHSGRPRHRLDDDGGDGRPLLEREDGCEVVGEVSAPGRLAARVCLALAGIGRADLIDVEQRLEQVAVGGDAADRSAAEQEP
jgi:hypothetical protein